MRVKYIVGGFIALLAVVLIGVMCTIWRGRTPDGEAPADEGQSSEVLGAGGATESERMTAERPSDSRRSVAKRRKGRRKKPEASDFAEDIPGPEKDAEDEEDDDDDDDMSPEDRRLMDAIEQGRDDDDLERLVKLIPDVTASTNAEVRAELVDAIGWFDVQGMNHLLPFMADSDEDVRESAIDNWTSALDEVEDEKTRANMIGAVMQVLTDEDALESMSSGLIDMDEKIALQTLVDVIEGGKASPEGVAAAREQYEFLTGDEYTTIEAANQWLEENYEPPDPKNDADNKGQNR